MPPRRRCRRSKSFATFLDAGPSLSPVGAIDFELIGEQEGMLGNGWAVMCTYVMLWRAPAGSPYTAFCTVNEPTSLGFSNCVANAQSTLDTIVLRMPNSPCAGFDQMSVAQNIFHLVAGESQNRAPRPDPVHRRERAGPRVRRVRVLNGAGGQPPLSSSSRTARRTDACTRGGTGASVSPTRRARACA